jgi:energy-coupling factor transporter ATP-binding protein EcfA2
MILRRIELKHFGRFGECAFDLRPGPNLLAGPSESGKSTLLTAVGAVLFGAADRERFRPWGRPAPCAGAVVFEAAGGTLRVERDFVDDQVTAVETDASGKVDRLAAALPAGASAPKSGRYHALLGRFFGVETRWLQAALTGELAAPAGLVGAGAAADSDRELAQVQRRLEELGREWFETRRRLDELPPLRERIGELAAALETQESGPPSASPVSPVGDGPEGSRRQALERELARTGLPRPLPPGLPELLEQAGAIRAEMVAMQTEAAGLRQQLQERPGVPWRMAAALSLLAAAVGGAAGYLRPDWLTAGLAAGGAAAVLPLGYGLWRELRERGERRRVEAQIGAIEERREEAQGRLAGLDEGFRRLGLSPSAVEIARMQKNLGRHRQLLCELEEPGGAPEAAAAADPAPPSAELEELRRREAALAQLPEALRRIEAEGERLRARETQLSRGREVAPSAGPDRLAALLAEAGRHLAQLSGGRYVELRPAAGGGWSLAAEDGAWRPLTYFSRGTAACARLAAHLALSRPPGGREPLPLLLDEPLADLDRPQTAEALRLLERLADGQQLLLASRDEDLARRGGGERWHLLPLGERKVKKSRQAARTAERNDDDGQLHLL